MGKILGHSFAVPATPGIIIAVLSLMYVRARNPVS
jgi:hypothetical protein